MKSVFLTFIMFAVLFGILKLNIVSLFNNFWFPLLSLILFIIVISIAVALFGLPKKSDILAALKIKRKDADDEKDK